MIKLKVQVDDWDTGESIELALPCDVKNKVDTSHSLYIIDWESDLTLGYYDDIIELNNVIDDINAECPSITIEILDAILHTSGCSDLGDKDFIRKICSSDFMLEEITGVTGATKEEKCARYLATEMMIPFAKNITDIKLETICEKADKVEWKKVWEHYEAMGFEIIVIDTKLYAFHWGDAVEE